MTQCLDEKNEKNSEDVKENVEDARKVRKVRKRIKRGNTSQKVKDEQNLPLPQRPSPIDPCPSPLLSLT